MKKYNKLVDIFHRSQLVGDTLLTMFGQRGEDVGTFNYYSFVLVYIHLCSRDHCT